MTLRTFLTAGSLILVGALTTVNAQDLYWDLNGTADGVGNVGGFQDGLWDDSATNLVWNTDSDGGGDGVIQAWADNNIAHFAAGTDATDGIVNIPVAALPQTVTGLMIEEGKFEFQGNNGSIVLGANPSRVNNGAILQMPSTGFSIVTITAGQVMTLDGGTIASKITGVGSGIWSGLGTIELTSLGGILDTPNGAGGAYSIMAYTGTINLSSGTTAATLTKKGPSELRLRNNNNFTALDVQGGLLRVDGTGGTTQSFGALTGTVTLHGGANANSQDGAALGTSASIVSPATRSFVLNTTNGPNTMIVLNAGMTVDGPISGAGGLMLNGWARADGGGATNAIGSQTQLLTLRGTNTYGGATTINFGTLVAANGSAIPDTSRVDISTSSSWGGLNGGVVSTYNTAVFQTNTSETIGSLAGGNATRGSVNISGAAVTLTTGADNTTSTFSGSITGTGSLAKDGSGTFTMDGVKTYTGDTSVLEGTLSTNSASLADAADVFMTTGGIFNLNYSGTDTIDSLFFDNASQAIGTWGGIGSGAMFESSFFTGAGLLGVTTFVPPAGELGDFNDDGKVDAADYVIWRKNETANNPLPNDNGLGTQADRFTLWKANFGNPMPGAGGGVGAVPEPSAMVMLLLGVAALAGGRRRG